MTDFLADLIDKLAQIFAGLSGSETREQKIDFSASAISSSDFHPKKLKP
jgi:hypothetical protein